MIDKNVPVKYLDLKFRNMIESYGEDICREFEFLSGLKRRSRHDDYPKITIESLEGTTHGLYYIFSNKIKISEDLKFDRFCSVLCHEIYHSHEPDISHPGVEHKSPEDGYDEYYSCPSETLARAYGDAYSSKMSDFLTKLYKHIKTKDQRTFYCRESDRPIIDINKVLKEIRNESVEKIESLFLSSEEERLDKLI